MAEASIKGISLSVTANNAADKRVAIVHTQWNKEIIDALVSGAKDELLKQGVKPENVLVVSVPGSYELPLGAKFMIDSSGVDAVLCIGCLIKGETMHFEYICEAVTQGIMRLNLDTGIPVIFGVLCVLTEEQAKARAGLLEGKHNHGIEWAQSALQMAALRTKHLVTKERAAGLQ